MELEFKLRETFSSNSIFLSENFPKPYRYEEFPFEIPHSFSKNNTYLQDFRHLDQFNLNGSSSNSIFVVQNQSFESFNPYPFSGSAQKVEDFYECKPFADSNNGGNGQVMDNINNLGYLNLPQKGCILMNSDEDKHVNFIVPDEISCITSENTGFYSSKVAIDKNGVSPFLRRTYKVKKKSNVVKGQWSIEEDRLLIRLVEQFGVRKWSHIAQVLPGRIGKQCRERWHNHLKPDIKKDSWSEEEDRVLIQAHSEIGNKWAEIAKKLPGRTENSIKNHWNATKRRQNSKRKCRSKYPKVSLLQEYIKSLNLDLNPIRYQRKSSNSMAKTSNSSKMKPLPLPLPLPPPETSEMFFPNDRFDFNVDPEFCFDENMFPDGCSIDSLIDDIGHNTGEEIQYCEMDSIDDDDDDDTFEMDIPVEMGTVMEFDVKKEMDLVEMISQV